MANSSQPGRGAALEARYPANFAATLPEPYRSHSFNLRDRDAYAIDRFGRSTGPTGAEAMARAAEGGYRIVFVHGSMYNPEGDALENPHLTIYEVMRRQLDGIGRHTGIGWDSVSFTPATLLEAWRQGQATWYGLTFANARREAPTLARYFSALDAPYAIVCHSIGCEMVRQALSVASTRPARILMLSPDTDYAAFEAWSVRNVVPTLHAVARRDGVLRFSRWARRNAAFTPSADQSTYVLKRFAIDEFAPGRPRFSTDYANPRRFLDHMAALEVDALWDHYRAFLDPAR